MKPHTARILLLVIIALLFIISCTSIPSQKTDTKNRGYANYPPQPLGTMHLNIVKRYTSVLLPRNVCFIFDPATNDVQMHHKMSGDNIWIYLNKDSRSALIAACTQYLAEYKANALTEKGQKQKGAFGTSNIMMAWGVLGSAHEAYPTLRFDYQFITSSRPYFILATKTTKAADGSNSPAIRIALSPAQCKELMTILNENTYNQILRKLKEDYEKFDDEISSTTPPATEN